MIRCVLFDLDGTLIDSLELYIQAVKRTLKDTIFEEVPTARLATLRLNSEPRLLGYFVPSGAVEAAHRRFLANYCLLHEEYFDGVYPGIQELLASLRRSSVKMGIVTGKSRGAWEITRSHAGLQL
ncbi:MAG: HAD hydrolase-like protein [Gemmatimonadetes bacterium]|nr:HAD hydrolase-like protein [Gemmatimonadota bacterium]